MSLDVKLRELTILLKERMIDAKFTITVTKHEHWTALLDELNLWDVLKYVDRQNLYAGVPQAIQVGDTTLAYAPPDDRPQCTGVLVHSEYVHCPRCDR